MSTEDDVSDCATWGDEALLDHLQGRMSEGQARILTSHLVVCPGCSARRQELAPLALLNAPEEMAPSPRLEKALQALVEVESARRMPELRPDEPVRRKPPTRRVRFRRLPGGEGEGSPVWKVVAAAAAVALFALAIGYALSRPAPIRPAPSVTQAPPPLVPVDPEPAPVVPDPVPPPAPKPIPEPVPAVGEPPKPPPVPEPSRPSPAPPPSAPEPAPPPPSPRPTVVADAAPPAPAEFGRVLRIAGRAERPGVGPIRKGDVLFVGQEIAARTGPLLVETADGSLVVLRSGTVLTPRLDGADLTLRMAEGEVACSVLKRPRAFAVETAHGQAVVKGTVFGVRIGGGSSTVTVSRGRVDVGGVDVTAGHRAIMAEQPRVEAVNADRALSWAYDAGLKVVGPLWLSAGSPTSEVQAPMTRGRLDGQLGEAVVFAAVDSRTLPTFGGRFLAADGDVGGTVTIAVDVPEDGRWYLWGRFFAPGTGQQIWRDAGPMKDNDPNSFYVSVDGGKETVFGNLKLDADLNLTGYRRWYWHGDGKVEVGRPAPVDLGVLSKGRHVIRVRNRDAVETSGLRLATRLDMLCLTRDPEYRPRDEDAKRN